MDYRWAEQSIVHNHWTETPLGYKIHLYYDDELWFNYPTLNPAIYKVTQGQASKAWAGPFAAYCGFVRPFVMSMVNVQDMDLRTFADVVVSSWTMSTRRHSTCCARVLRSAL